MSIISNTEAYAHDNILFPVTLIVHLKCTYHALSPPSSIPLVPTSFRVTFQVTFSYLIILIFNSAFMKIFNKAKENSDMCKIESFLSI